jgi:hypothetical protein
VVAIWCWRTRDEMKSCGGGIITLTPLAPARGAIASHQTSFTLSDITKVYAIRTRSNAIGRRVKMALFPKLRSPLMLNARSLTVRQSTTTRRNLHLAPPYLLEDYIPRYHLLSSIDASKKRSLAYAHLRECNLCPRLCGVNRYEKTGVCLIGAETVKVNTIAPHFGEGM